MYRTMVHPDFNVRLLEACCARIEEALENQKELPADSPFGKGDAAEQIVKIIDKKIL